LDGFTEKIKPFSPRLSGSRLMFEKVLQEAASINWITERRKEVIQTGAKLETWGKREGHHQ